LRSGRYVCVFTTDKRYALLSVRGLDADAAGILLDVTTFQKPGD
jgi:hypothetical protein